MIYAGSRYSIIVVSTLVDKFLILAHFLKFHRRSVWYRCKSAHRVTFRDAHVKIHQLYIFHKYLYEDGVFFLSTRDMIK